MNTEANDAFAQARDHFLAGTALLDAGDAAAAAARFEASLALLPGRVSTLVNLAAAQVRLGRSAGALGTTAQILAQEPDNAEALLHRAAAEAQLGHRDAALADYDRLLALQPQLADAHTHRGSLLRELGRPREAAAAFARAAELGADPALGAYYRAAVGDGAAPPTAPAAYVEALFDSYAPAFDAHLGRLGYRVPELLDGLLPMGARYGHAVDAGCGTGLVGAQLRPRCERLTGIDLSAAMLDEARRRGVYDRLQQADAAAWLRAQPAGSCGLVASADVFIYVGDLAATFAATRHALAAGGLFAFSVEQDDGLGFTLRPSLRYAHSAAYVAAQAAGNGFALQSQLAAPIRADDSGPVDGLLFVLRAV